MNDSDTVQEGVAPDGGKSPPGSDLQTPRQEGSTGDAAISPAPTQPKSNVIAFPELSRGDQPSDERWAIYEDCARLLDLFDRSKKALRKHHGKRRQQAARHAASIRILGRRYRRVCERFRRRSSLWQLAAISGWLTAIVAVSSRL